MIKVLKSVKRVQYYKDTEYPRLMIEAILTRDFRGLPNSSHTDTCAGSTLETQCVQLLNAYSIRSYSTVKEGTNCSGSLDVLTSQKIIAP